MAQFIMCRSRIRTLLVIQKLATTSTVSFHADETLIPTILSPSNHSCLKTVFNLTFILPEKAFPDSLVLLIEPIDSTKVDAAGTRTIVFDDEFAGVRSSFWFFPAIKCIKWSGGH